MDHLKNNNIISQDFIKLMQKNKNNWKFNKRNKKQIE